MAVGASEGDGGTATSWAGVTKDKGGGGTDDGMEGGDAGLWLWLGFDVFVL